MATAPVDIPVQIKGLSDLQKLERRMEALEREVTRLQGKLPAASNNVRKFGRASAYATKTVGGFKKAVGGLLGPIAAATAGVAGLTAGFTTLANQDFAEAKVRTLGVNSEELRQRLIATSKELKGQASVVELTAAAYDVASAGFASAAEAQKILKASSLGAVGGFSDINTVANATTSVLNAYGLSADKAGQLVDGFIQTQNDGKIVLDEYASNIGKLAPVAASLGIPLAEVNGAIAAITANGLPAEVAITALRSGIARLAAPTKQSSDILAKYGVQIDANTIAAEGFEKSLQKLAKVTDKADLQTLIGTEAGQALAPLLNDLPKLNRLIKNQAKAAGVAQTANDQAAQTITGAWKEVQTAFQNLFSSQSAAAEAIIPILQGVADAINAINTPAGMAAVKIAGVTVAVIALTKAIAALKATALAGWISRLTPILAAGKGALAAKAVAAAGLTKALAGLKAALAILGGPIGLLAAGVLALGAAFVKTRQEKQAFDDLIKSGTVTELSRKMDELKGKLQVAEARLKALRENGVSPVSRAFKQQQELVDQLQAKLNQIEGTYKVKIDIQTMFDGGISLAGIKSSGYGRNADGLTYTVAGITYNAKTGMPVAPPKPINIPDPIGGGGSGSGSGSGSGVAPQNDTEQAEALLRTLNQQLLLQKEAEGLDRDRLRIFFEMEDTLKDIQGLQGVSPELLGQLSQAAKDLAKIKDDAAVLEFVFAQTAAATLAAQDALRPLEEQRRLLEAKLNGTEREARLQIEIENATRGLTPELAKQVELRIRGNAALQDQVDKLSDLQQLAGSISDSLEGGIVAGLSAAVDALVTGADDLDKKLKKIAQGVLADIGQQLIKFGISNLFNSIGGGLPIPGFAEGGRPDPGKISIVGEKGPELFVPDSSGTVIPNEFFDSARDSLQSSSGTSNQDNDFDDALGTSNQGNDFDDARDSLRSSGVSADNANSEAFSAAAAAIARNTTIISNRQSSTNQETSFNNFADSLKSDQREPIRFETVRVGQMDMVTKDEALKIGAESAKAAEASVLSALRNKPKVRRSVGIN